LFHAVVELQRLRASSERKFQRWFFETRAELERAQEVKSVLEADLEQERRNRAEAIRQAVERDQGNSLAEKQLAEMRKELAISKDEARRAWEELGRREQAERDRTLSLQSGQPTIVGGVQVVPMTQPGQQMGGQGSGNYASDYARGGYTSPQAQPSQPSGSAGPESYYRQEKSSSVLPPQQRSGGGGGSGGAFSEGEYVTDVQGNFILDMYGRRIPLDAPRSAGSDSDAEVEEYDTPATTNPPSRSHELPTSSATAPGPSGGQYTGNYDEQDYSGEGYAAPGWEEVPRQQAAPEWEKVPRHHHPTRLSDVMEEDDERSRTSTSQVSRG
jgi:hypothetical protein